MLKVKKNRTNLLNNVLLTPSSKSHNFLYHMVCFLKVDAVMRFNELWSAKTRFDHLTPYQLLRRDLKRIILAKV